MHEPTRAQRWDYIRDHFYDLRGWKVQANVGAIMQRLRELVKDEATLARMSVEVHMMEVPYPEAASAGVREAAITMVRAAVKRGGAE